ncbi:3-oxo-5-alpha-steroid 4-dehydrogenase 1 [Hypanus sabinus]|uniref:3-oxo-5-alpha-steroid 4-dehydrogenase 1 n=1 Tax=Hypanus sabinus TaxID=79690 RepID=UPI0028C45A12|nr:3-oxo-5-alpha-steroid 4-dehydrogenase 1 [Hypanus sabinus]
MQGPITNEQFSLLRRQLHWHQACQCWYPPVLRFLRCLCPTRFVKGLCRVQGSAVWFLGLVVNLHSDHILRNLRKPGETGYKIPRGGLFEYVTAANFFGETVEWIGFAIACWSLPSAAFALFTFFILLARGKHHHRWYLEKFEDYPKTRKILIPFIY